MEALRLAQAARSIARDAGDTYDAYTGDACMETDVALAKLLEAVRKLANLVAESAASKGDS